LLRKRHGSTSPAGDALSRTSRRSGGRPPCFHGRRRAALPDVPRVEPFLSAATLCQQRFSFHSSFHLGLVLSAAMGDASPLIPVLPLDIIDSGRASALLWAGVLGSLGPARTEFRRGPAAACGRRSESHAMG